MSHVQSILVYGATSAICHEVCKLYAAENARFFLVGRTANKLAAIGDDLVARGGELAGSSSYDFNNVSQHAPTIAQAREALDKIDVIIIAHGSLPEQAACEQSDELSLACLNDNFTSTSLIANACGRLLAEQTTGNLAVISSVAGDRGRKSNYIYGAAKAGIDTMLQGLQGRFAGANVGIINIKPGMVDTPMTSHMDKSPLLATPQAIAPAIKQAISQQKKLVYVPGFWRLIMLIIRLLPTAILAKLPI